MQTYVIASFPRATQSYLPRPQSTSHTHPPKSSTQSAPSDSAPRPSGAGVINSLSFQMKSDGVQGYYTLDLMREFLTSHSGQYERKAARIISFFSAQHDDRPQTLRGKWAYVCLKVHSNG